MAHAEQILRQSLKQVATEHNYADPRIEVSTVSTEGANYSSYLFAASISSQGKDDLKLFAKVAAIGEKLRDQSPIRMFDIEGVFYNYLLKEYQQLEEEQGIQEQHRFKLPKLYCCTTVMYEETIILENLSTKGYELHDRMKSVDWEYAAAAFTELAKLHALSIALKNKRPEVFKKMQDEFALRWTSTEVMEQFIVSARKNAVENAREDNKEKLKGYLTGGSFGMEGFKKFYEPGDNPIIRHGDFRPSNLMHRKNEDGTVDVITIDYQTLQCGTPVTDLFYFIFLGTDKQFRDKYFHQLLDHYYSELKDAVTRHGLDIEQNYSRKNFDDDVKENISYGLLMAATTLGIVTVESADAPKVNSDMDFDSFHGMKMGSEYANRLNGIVDNFVEWGLL